MPQLKTQTEIEKDKQQKIMETVALEIRLGISQD